VNPDTPLGNRDHRARAQLIVDQEDDPGQQLGQDVTAEPLPAKAHDRGSRGAGKGQEGVEVGVERNQDAVIGAGALQDQDVGRRAEPEVGGVSGIDAAGVEVPDGAPRQSLVEEQPL
jgi:hypothetical protein